MMMIRSRWLIFLLVARHAVSAKKWLYKGTTTEILELSTATLRELIDTGHIASDPLPEEEPTAWLVSFVGIGIATRLRLATGMLA